MNAKTIDTDDAVRSERPLDTGWRFFLGETDLALEHDLDATDWEDVRLPHDWAIHCPTDPDIEQDTQQGYRRRAHVGWYRRRFQMQPEPGQRIRLRLDGAYRNTEVWVNGHSLGERPSGYATRIHDITDYLREDGNQLLAVRCDNTGHDADRWYCGAGLYRRVWLTRTGDVAIKPWGVGITTPEVSEQAADVAVEVAVENDREENVTAQVSGKIAGPDGDKQATLDCVEVELEAGGEGVVELDATVAAPSLWSPESPSLYAAELQVSVNGDTTDTVEETFGIRHFRFTVEEGFELNGEQRTMKGVCLHHDLGCLGTAFFTDGWERRLRRLKELGCDAIRTAHNIPAAGLLDLCDRLGILVIDEAYDKWQEGCMGDLFDEWWKRDVESLVLRDRNHPSVIVWSVGNEVENQGRPGMIELCEMLSDYVKSLDSTRPTMVALEPHVHYPEIWSAPVEEKAEVVKNIAETVDIVGLNYQDQWYDAYHEAMPDQVFIATEAFHFYQHRENASWAMHAQNPWFEVEDHSYVTGQFLWTGIEYLGEATQEWPLRGWKGAPIDIAGYAKPRAWWHASVWRDEDRPVVRAAPRFREGDTYEPADWSFPPLVDHWNLPVREGEVVEVWAFSNGHSVELLLNGETKGTRVMSECPNRIASFRLPYEPGDLVAVSRDESGEQIARHELSTAEEPAGLKLSVDQEVLQPNDQDLAHVTIDIVDENGVRVPHATEPIGVEVRGAGRLIGMDNGDLCCHEPYDANRRHAYHGRCMAVVRAGHTPGPIEITAVCPDVGRGTIELDVSNADEGGQ